MTLKSSGRTKLNIKVYQELIEKSDNAYFEWKKQWGWLVPEYKLMKEELSSLSEEKKDSEKTKVILGAKRSLKPFPETVNKEYGWICNKEEFKLERWGRDDWSTPPLPPDD
ncbi:hypothetical protein CBL_08694 [Carabus blaptoides fortunei]